MPYQCKYNFCYKTNVISMEMQLLFKNACNYKKTHFSSYNQCNINYSTPNMWTPWV